MYQSTPYYEQLPAKVKAFFDRQYRDSYELFNAARNPRTGLYGDAYFAFRENPEARCSMAATGVGLISLSVADMEGWDEHAADKAVITLRCVLGQIEGCRPARDAATGFFAHFIDMETGENMNSEISTIDTSLLVVGALIAGQHFKDRAPEIGKMAQELLQSIDWRVVVADKEKGVINMIVKDGKGIAPLPAYNEYVLVSYLALLCQPDDQDIQDLWHNNFAEARIKELPISYYRDIPVLADHPPEVFLSSFVHQFPFFLVPEYATSPVYREFYANACLADRMKWKELSEVPSYVWGYGAGPNGDLEGLPGYHADAIGRSPGNIASAYVVAGFLPVYPAGIYDLYALYQQHIPYDQYTNAEDQEDEQKFRAAYKYGLHRYSWRHLEQPERWYPTHVTLIDWSSMLYGLCAFKRGMTFFTERLVRM